MTPQSSLLAFQVIQSLREPMTVDDSRTILSDLSDGTSLSRLCETLEKESEAEVEFRNEDSAILDDVEQVLSSYIDSENKEALSLQVLLQALILSVIASPKNKPYITRLSDLKDHIKLPVSKLITCFHRVTDSLASLGFDLESPSPVQPLRLQSRTQSEARNTNFASVDRPSEQNGKVGRYCAARREVAIQSIESTLGTEGETRPSSLDTTREYSGLHTNAPLPPGFRMSFLTPKRSYSSSTQPTTTDGTSCQLPHHMQTMSNTSRKVWSPLGAMEPHKVKQDAIFFQTPVFGRVRSRSLGSSCKICAFSWARLPNSRDPFFAIESTEADKITLPEIPSSSKSSSEKMVSPWVQPFWADSPELLKRLRHQTHSEAEHVFGDAMPRIPTPAISSESENESVPDTISPLIRYKYPKNRNDTYIASHFKGSLSKIPHSDIKTISDAVPPPICSRSWSPTLDTDPASDHKESAPAAPLSTSEDATGSNQNQKHNHIQRDGPNLRRLRSRPLREETTGTNGSLGYGRLAKPPKTRRPRAPANSQGKGRESNKAVPVTSPLGSTQDRIHHSYQCLRPGIPLEFGPRHEGYFNPYRVRPNQKGAIIDEEKIRITSERAQEILKDMDSSLHDSNLRELTAGTFWLDDLLVPPMRNDCILDIVRNIDAKLIRNKDMRNILNFLRLSILRVHQHMVDEEDFHMARQQVSKYDNATMDVYLCLHGLCLRLGSAWNGRHLSLIIFLLRKISKLVGFLKGNLQPLAFDSLLTSLNKFRLVPTSQEVKSPDLIGSIWNILRNTQGIHIATVKDALGWSLKDEVQRGIVEPAFANSVSRLKRLSSDQDFDAEPSSQNLPSKRQRLEIDSDSGFYGSKDLEDSNEHRGFSDVLSREVESLAERLEAGGRGITVASSSGCAPRSYCDCHNIRQLKPDQWLGEDLINTVLGCSASEHSRSTIFLGTQVYPEIKKPNFGKSKSWIENCARDKKWSLAICELRHWIAVLIDWRSHSIVYYDAQCLEGVNDPRHEVIGSILEPWLISLDDHSGTRWRISQAKGGPSQLDNSSCGVYATIVLGTWSTGKEITSLKLPALSPDMYRHQLLNIILQAEKEGRVQIG